MQARIKRLLDERARALAAVSHDLRTPLTRMRLRAELVDDEKLRDQMATDLDAMAAMIDATLDYLRGLQDSEVARPIDMNALLQSLAEDAAVLGKPISVEGLASAPYTGRLSALRRALQNLIDNAIKYGHSARLCVSDDATELRIGVEDEGPGIPPVELGRVGEPYYRPDASRSRETGGVGLGLSIARDIALIHGGELRLANRPQGGFSATLVLPRTLAKAV
jgi:signal transduction histidine kinase